MCEYRPHGGGRGVAKKRVTLGKTSQLTPEQARKAAGEMLAAVRRGRNPARISQLDGKESAAAGLARDVAGLLTAGLPRSMCPSRYFMAARMGSAEGRVADADRPGRDFRFWRKLRTGGCVPHDVLRE